MIDIESIDKIVATYKKHGWNLRRVLLSAAVFANLPPNFSTVLGNAEVTESDLNAAWFSRPPASGSIAWELRLLGTTPIALVENIDDRDPKFEDTLNAVEVRLRKLAIAKNRA